jgi:hypothetical protein
VTGKGLDFGGAKRPAVRTKRTLEAKGRKFDRTQSTVKAAPVTNYVEEDWVVVVGIALVELMLHYKHMYRLGKD